MLFTLCAVALTGGWQGKVKIMTKIEAAIQCAHDLYCAPSNDDIELDDNPQISAAANGGGVWVQAWVWVPNEEIEAELARAVSK